MSAELAKKILSNLQRSFPRAHEFRQVEGSQFPHVNPKFYARTSRTLSDLGFRPLGDIEDVTLRRSGKPDMRTFIRLMTDAESTTVSACYHLAPPFLWRGVLWVLRIPRKIVEFESYSGSDYTHATTIAPPSTTLPRPETMTKDCVSRKMSIAEMYQRHRSSIAELPKPLRVIRSVGDAIALQQSQNSQLRGHLEKIGWITKEYLQKQGLAPSNVDEVYLEVQRLVESGFEVDN
jgi:hypothetical protein